MRLVVVILLCHAAFSMNEHVIDIESLPLMKKIPKKPKIKMHLLSSDELDTIAQFIALDDAQKLSKSVKDSDPQCLRHLACWTYFHTLGHEFAQKYLNGDTQLLRSAFKEKGFEVLERINEHDANNKFDLDGLYMLGFDTNSAMAYAIMSRELVALPKTIKNCVLRIMKLRTNDENIEEFPAQKKVFAIIQHHENIHYEQYRYNVRAAYCFCGLMLCLWCAFITIVISIIVKSMQVNRAL